MAFSSVLQMYLGWANSIMCERGVLINGLDELQDGVIFCHLIELLTGTDLGLGQQDSSDEDEDQKCLNNTVQVALDYLQGIGVKVKATASGVVCGELKSILDMMWAIILHCTIHSPDLPVGQRTVRNGRKTMLNWCVEELGASFDISATMVKSFSHNHLLSDLISVHCAFEEEQTTTVAAGKENEDQMVTSLTNAILAAEDHLGISKTLIGPSDVINGTVDEHALLIYLALLRRKVSVLMSRTSSLSSLSSNENIAFNIPMNSRHEIVEALQKAHSFRFIRSQCKGDLRRLLLQLRGPKLKKFREHLRAQTRGPGTASVTDTSISSQALPSQSPHRRIDASTDSISSRTSPSQAAHRYTNLSNDEQDSDQCGVDVSPQQSVSYVVKNWTTMASVQSESLADRKKSPSHQPLDNELYSSNTVTSPATQRHNNKSHDSAGPDFCSQNAAKSPIQRPHDKSHDNYGDDRVNIQGQRLCESSEVDIGGGGDAVSNGKQQDGKSIAGGAVFERRTRRTSGNDGDASAPDELLSLLEAISQESTHLRKELNESYEREHVFKKELDRSASAAEEHVVSKLVQELEMLRAENERLFRDSANARNSNAHDRKTTAKLQATITGLQNEVEHLNADNFRLKLRIKLLESHRVERERADGEDSLQQTAADMFLMDQFMDLPSGCTPEEVSRHLHTNQEMLGNFSDVNNHLADTLAKVNDEAVQVKVSSRRIQQENQLLKMTCETSRLEVDSSAIRCQRLEDHLSAAQKKNEKLVQELQAIAKQHTAPQADDKMQVFLSVRQLEEENELLQRRMELADEDRQLLKKELLQYKKNQSSIDVMFKNVETSSSSRQEAEDVTKHSIARDRVVQSVRGKDEREAAQTQPQDASLLPSRRLEAKSDDGLSDVSYSKMRIVHDEVDVVSRTNESYLTTEPKKPTYDTVGMHTHVRKSSLGDLIVAKATGSPPKEENIPGANQTESTESVSHALLPTAEYGNYASLKSRQDSVSEPSVASVAGGDLTDDDLIDHTMEDTDQTEFHVQELTSVARSIDRTFASNEINSSASRRPGLAEAAKSEETAKQRSDQNHNFPTRTYLDDKDNPRLARLRELRKNLGIDKSRESSSKSNLGISCETPEYELRSRLTASGRPSRIAKWNKFRSYNDEDSDLGSSYVDVSAVKRSSSLPLRNASPGQTRNVAMENPTVARSSSKLSNGLQSSSSRDQERPDLGKMTLDAYVEALKHRVKYSEIEPDDLTDEYRRLPEHFQEPRRLAEKSPNRNNEAKASENETVTHELPSTFTNSSSHQKSASRKDIKTTATSSTILKKETHQSIRQERTQVWKHLPSRVSGDGMSDGQTHHGDEVLDLSCSQAVYSETDTHENAGAQGGHSKPAKSQTIKRTPSLSRINTHVQNDAEDAFDHTVLSSQGDTSLSSLTGSAERLHLSPNSEEARLYTHRLLKEEEQDYANSIIEKYLEQLSVLPQ